MTTPGPAAASTTDLAPPSTPDGPAAPGVSDGTTLRLLRVVARQASRRPWLLAWLAFAPVAVVRAGRLTEADTFWEIRTGLVTISHRAIPAVDSFSWTAHGRPWTLNSWAFDVLIALAYRLGGLPAVAWLSAGLVLTVAALALALARQLGAVPPVAAASMLLAAPLLVGWLSARPQLVDYIAVLALVMLLRGIAAGRPPGRRILATGAITALWVNLHAGALLGVAICLASALALAGRRGTRSRGLYCLAAGAAGLAGAFINPYGLGLLTQTSQVQADSAGLIVEWDHVNPASPVQDTTLILAVAALVLVVRRREVVVGAALAVALAGSVTAVRFLPFVALITVPVLAAWASRPAPAVLRYARSRRVMLIRCGTGGVLALAAIAVPSLAHIGRPASGYPVAIVADIPHGCRVFTTDLLGGFLILARPDAPVSLDTRNTLYGRQLLVAEERVLAGHGDLTRGLAGAGCVLVPAGSGLARRLAADPGWQLRAAERPAGVLFVRS